MDLFVVSVLVTSINIDSLRRERPPQRDPAYFMQYLHKYSHIRLMFPTVINRNKVNIDHLSLI